MFDITSAESPIPQQPLHQIPPLLLQTPLIHLSLTVVSKRRKLNIR